MTIKELIDKLQQFDEDKLVLVEDQSSCVKPENFNLGIGAAYAQIEAKNKIWEGLGFVLQWAKYGLKK